MNPCAVACAVAGDAGNLADIDLVVPAFLHGDKEVKRGSFAVGEEDIVKAIFIDIDEAQAGVVAVGIDNGSVFGEGKWPLHPAMLAGVILIDGGPSWAADEQLTAA